MAKGSKLEDIKSSIQKAIDSFDERGIIGPIGYLEEALEDLDSAIEEENTYLSESNGDDE